jgi:phosphomannomutase/phosphoglucomutase
MWKSGHSFIKDKLIEEQAVFAGESSGHIFFADRYFGFDDGIYASLRLLQLLVETRQPLSELLKSLPQAFTSPEERPACPDDKKHAVVKGVQESFINDGYQMLTVDGVRVQFLNGWGLIRASNTEPVLSLRFEALSEEDLVSYRKLAWEKVEAVGRQHGLDLKAGN